MKQFTYTIILAAALFASCNSSTPKTETTETVATTTDSVSTADAALATYQCPMKCQGDTTYNAPGQCPVCGMDLEKL